VVAEYLATPAPETVLALVGEGLRKDAPLAKACAKTGSVLIYEVAKSGLPKWVGEQFARHGVKANTDACRALVELVGDNLQELATEVEKLSTWAGHDDIGPVEVELLVAARADVPPFVLTDAWGRRDVGAVLAACESILERSTRSGEVHMLVGRLAAHVRRVRSCQELDLAGVRPREAAGELKMHPFAAEKAFAQSRNFSVEELRGAIVHLADLDLAIKGGSRLPSELELQRTLVAITRPHLTLRQVVGAGRCGL
jgi:DNA polymerase-3 subunit delta